MTWKTVIVRGLLEGLTLGLIVGGIAALALGMWLLGPVLLGGSLLALQLAANDRRVRP